MTGFIWNVAHTDTINIGLAKMKIFFATTISRVWLSSKKACEVLGCFGTIW